MQPSPLPGSGSATPSGNEPATPSGNEPATPSGNEPATPTGHGSATPPESRPVNPSEELVQAKTVIRGSSRGPQVAIQQSPAAVAKVLLGSRLNHFFLEELIGGGGMGAVFRARDEQLDRVVAIKVIPFVGDDPELQRRFRNEAQSAAKLDHPRIARVFEVGAHEQWHYIVFEYVRGTNIRDAVVNGGVLPIDDALYYTCQLAEAIQHAADRGIVHRDIKPSNVLIDDDGSVKLVDMGLARSESFEVSEDLTASGVTLGTFDYISPEQARDPRDADLRSDIYSLGCTLYFMLTGRPPYPGGTMLQKLLSHGNSPPPDAREFRDGISGELMSVIRKMLAKSPDDRYQLGTGLIADLREVAYRDGLTRTQAVGPVTISEPSLLSVWLERHAPWLVAVLLLLGTAGLLHLDAVASRQDVTVPSTATAPIPIQATPAATSIDRPGSASPETITPEADTLEVGEPPAEASGRSSDVDARSDPAEPTESPAEVPSEPGGDGELSPTVAPSLMIVDPRTEQAISVDPIEAVEPPTMIRVVDGTPLIEGDFDGAVQASSLANALTLADELGVNHIELSQPVVESQPVSISRDNLRITSSRPEGTIIIFRPGDSIRMERSSMLEIGSHQVAFDNLHFWWSVPTSEINGGCLFAIRDNPLVEMANCTVTIDNPADCDAVYAFEVSAASDQPESASTVADGSLPLVAIELTNVIVRGEIDMIHMHDAAELQLNWDNGLLSITDHMIDTAGASSSLNPTARPILLWLTRLTAHTPRGLLRMHAGKGESPVSVDRFARNSVFVVDPETPHFEFSGFPTVTDESLLQLRGSTNAYDTNPARSDPVLVQTSNDEDRRVRLNRLTTEWPAEDSPRWFVRWMRGEVRLSDAPASRATPADYEQIGAVRTGFEEKSLPVLPSLESPLIGPTRDNLPDRAAVDPSETR